MGTTKLKCKEKNRRHKAENEDETKKKDSVCKAQEWGGRILVTRALEFRKDP